MTVNDGVVPVLILKHTRNVKASVCPVFSSKEAAEEHGLKLCKDWIDKRP